MTRDQFIDLYLKASDLEEAVRIEGGFSVEGIRTIALQCNCDEPDCLGWAMVPDRPESIRCHMMIYEPDGDGEGRRGE